VFSIVVVVIWTLLSEINIFDLIFDLNCVEINSAIHLSAVTSACMVLFVILRLAHDVGVSDCVVMQS